MTRRQQLWAIFGPLVASVLLLAIFFFAPIKLNLDGDKVLADASTSMAGNVLRGDAVKNNAIAEKKYVPFFGSSELSRISPFHPSVLAEKYDRSYRPFLLGAPGTQSLSQFFMMQSMGQDLHHKKVVFILSPQWFVPEGVKEDYFDAYYSELQVLDWLQGVQKIQPSDRYLAERLQRFKKIQGDDFLMRVLKKLDQGELPNEMDQQIMKLKRNALSREDELFSKIGLLSKQGEIDKAAKELPGTYDVNELDGLATQIGEKSTSNNPFEIANPFYSTRLAKNIDKMKDSQVNWDYRFSPEFSDFQLVLSQLAKADADALFIIPPVNKHWSDYTGLSQEMLREYAKKVKYQLNSQGFQHVADFTDQAETSYFMADTIHLGWRGWLAADQKIAPFLTTPFEKPHYQIDKKFFGPEWDNQKPQDLR